MTSSPSALVLPALFLACSPLSMPTSHAAEAAPAAAISIKLDGIRITQDYIVDPPNIPFAHQQRDPWGVWHSGILMHLGVVGGPAAGLILVDQVTGNALLDSGETVGVDPTPIHNGMWERGNPSDFDMLQNTGHALAAPLYLSAPGKPCARITTLTGTLRVLMGDLGHLKHLTLVPKADPQGIPDLPDCGLTVTLTTKQEIQLQFPSDHLRQIHDIAYLAADGTKVIPNRTSTSGRSGIYETTFGFSTPPATVEISYYPSLTAAIMAFSLSNVPIAGHGDPSALICTATKVADAPVPPLPTSAPPSAPVIRRDPSPQVPPPHPYQSNF